jgi:hypothetical protein
VYQVIRKVGEGEAGGAGGAGQVTAIDGLPERYVY